MKNDQFDERELMVLVRELRTVLAHNIEGDVVELGCYKGMTSLRMQEILSKSGLDKKLYLYDSFSGLPEKQEADGSPAGMQFVAGELPASKKEVIRLFKQSGLPMPHIRKAWFSELTPKDIPDKVAFAFLDGDFYESIMDSLKLVWTTLTKGAVVVVDDYQNEQLPGAAKAVDEWLKNHHAKLSVEASLAVIRPA